MGHTLDVAVIGAGQAGLAVSYWLTWHDIRHLVLERGKIGESWRSQRWDSFCLNTPNWANELPGLAFGPEAPEAFSHRGQLVSYLERYARSFRAPIRQQAEVTTLERRLGGGYRLQIGQEVLQARAVVVASGSMSRPRLPEIARGLPADINSLTAGAYRNAAALPEGTVVVVGAGQSGCQVAGDLLAAGRRVYLCASRVGRIPRRYRGREILAWWRDMGFLEDRTDALDDPNVVFAAQPQVSGVDGGRTVSLQSLARDGATLLGRALAVDGSVLQLGTDLRDCIAFADEKSRACKAAIDAYIEREGIAAPAPGPDPGEPALPDLGGSDLRTSLDLREAGVTSVVWCTGFDADWRWLKVDVFDDQGRPRHRDGITASPGLYFLGFPWLSKRKSGILYGVGEDAARIANHVETFLRTAVRKHVRRLPATP